MRSYVKIKSDTINFLQYRFLRKGIKFEDKLENICEINYGCRFSLLLRAVCILFCILHAYVSYYDPTSFFHEKIYSIIFIIFLILSSLRFGPNYRVEIIFNDRSVFIDSWRKSNCIKLVKALSSNRYFRGKVNKKSYHVTYVFAVLSLVAGIVDIFLFLFFYHIDVNGYVKENKIKELCEATFTDGNINVGNAFEEYFDVPSWDYYVGTLYGSDEDGDGEADYIKEDEEVYEFTGSCNWSGKERTASIQIVEDGDYYSFYSLRVDGISQSKAKLSELIKLIKLNYKNGSNNNNDVDSESENSEEIESDKYGNLSYLFSNPDGLIYENNTQYICFYPDVIVENYGHDDHTYDFTVVDDETIIVYINSKKEYIYVLNENEVMNEYGVVLTRVNIEANNNDIEDSDSCIVSGVYKSKNDKLKYVRYFSEDEILNDYVGTIEEPGGKNNYLIIKDGEYVVFDTDETISPYYSDGNIWIEIIENDGTIERYELIERL